MADRFYYLETKEDADEAIAEFGQDAVLRGWTPGTGPVYDPGEPTPVYYPVTLVELAYSSYDIDGTRILAGDKKLLMAVGNLAFEPDPSYDINLGGTLANGTVTGGKYYSIIKVDPLKPGGTTILYTVQARS